MNNREITYEFVDYCSETDEVDINIINGFLHAGANPAANYPQFCESSRIVNLMEHFAYIGELEVLQSLMDKNNIAPDSEKYRQLMDIYDRCNY